MDFSGKEGEGSGEGEEPWGRCLSGAHVLLATAALCPSAAHSWGSLVSAARSCPRHPTPAAPEPCCLCWPALPCEVPCLAFSCVFSACLPFHVWSYDSA